MNNFALYVAAFTFGTKLQRFLFPPTVVLWWIITSKIILWLVDIPFSDVFLSGRILQAIVGSVLVTAWLLPQFWFAWMSHLGSKGLKRPEEGFPGFLASPIGFLWRRRRARINARLTSDE